MDVKPPSHQFGDHRCRSFRPITNMFDKTCWFPFCCDIRIEKSGFRNTTSFCDFIDLFVITGRNCFFVRWHNLASKKDANEFPAFACVDHDRRANICQPCVTSILLNCRRFRIGHGLYLFPVASQTQRIAFRKRSEITAKRLVFLRITHPFSIRKVNTGSDSNL